MVGNLMLKMVQDARLSQIESEENRMRELLSASMVGLVLPEIRPGVRGIRFDIPQTVFVRTKVTNALLSAWYCDALEFYEDGHRFAFMIRGAAIGIFEPLDRDFVIRF